MQINRFEGWTTQKTRCFSCVYSMFFFFSAGTSWTSPCALYCLVPFGTTSSHQFPKLAMPGLASDALQVQLLQAGCCNLNPGSWTKLGPGRLESFTTWIIRSADLPLSKCLVCWTSRVKTCKMHSCTCFARVERRCETGGFLLWVVILKRRNFSRRVLDDRSSWAKIFNKSRL